MGNSLFIATMGDSLFLSTMGKSLLLDASRGVCDVFTFVAISDNRTMGLDNSFFATCGSTKLGLDMSFLCPIGQVIAIFIWLCKKHCCWQLLN